MSRPMPNPSVGLRTVARQLVSQPGIVASVTVIVLLAALGLSGLPRTLERASREDLTATLTAADVQARNVVLSQQFVHRPPLDGDPLEDVRQVGRDFLDDEATPRITGVIADSDLVLTTPKFHVRDLPDGRDRPSEPVRFNLRYQDAAWERVELEEGRLPERAGFTTIDLPCPPGEEDDDGMCPVSLPVIEVVVTADMAGGTHLQVGDRLLLVPDESDAYWEGTPGSQVQTIRFVMEVVGIADLGDPDSDVWYGDRRLHVARQVLVDLDNRWVEGFGLISPEAYGDLMAALGGTPPWWQYEWRYTVDAEQVAASDFLAFATDLARLRLAHNTVEPGTPTFAVGTSLPELIDQHLGQRQQTLRILAVTVAGIVATVTAALLALGVLSTERQRAQLVLSRDRGASTSQVLTGRLYQAIALTALPVVGAFLATTWLFPGTDDATPYRMAFLLAVVAVLAFVVPVWGLARRPLGAIRSEVPWPPPRNPRRVVFETTLVLLALACVILVRRRDPSTLTGFDWLLVATPAVVGSAVGVIAIRLASPIGAALSWLASRARGAVGFLALRNVVQQAAATRVPLAVLVVCMATTSVSLVLANSIRDGQLAGSWRAIGADYVVSNSGSPLPDALLEIEGAEIVHATQLSVRSRVDNRRTATNVLAVDSARHEEVFGGTQGDYGFDLLTGPTESGAIPALASSTWTRQIRPFVGQEVMIPIGAVEVMVEIVGLLDEFPVLRRPFVIVDRSALEDAAGTTLATTLSFVSGPRSLGATLDELADEMGVEVASRYRELDRLAADPLVAWTMQGMLAGAVLAAVVGVAAMAASFAIGAARRRRDLAYLRTMGLRGSQAARMALVEQLPGTVLALGLGLVAGAATILAVRPAIDLSPMTGNRATPLVVDWPALGLLFVGAVVLLAAAGVIFVVVNRRQDLGQVLRVGDR